MADEEEIGLHDLVRGESNIDWCEVDLAEPPVVHVVADVAR